jgi:hypothetical protein
MDEAQGRWRGAEASAPAWQSSRQQHAGGDERTSSGAQARRVYAETSGCRLMPRPIPPGIRENGRAAARAPSLGSRGAGYSRFWAPRWTRNDSVKRSPVRRRVSTPRGSLPGTTTRQARAVQAPSRPTYGAIPPNLQDDEGRGLRPHGSEVKTMYEQDDEGHWMVFGRIVPTLAAEEWALILGDAIHNARSALDLLVTHLLALIGRQPNQRNGFRSTTPTERQEAKERFEDYLKGLRSAHATGIRQLQPFRNPTARESWLLTTLAELDNLDKHRLLHPVFAYENREGLADSGLENHVRLTPPGCRSSALRVRAIREVARSGSPARFRADAGAAHVHSTAKSSSVGHASGQRARATARMPGPGGKSRYPLLQQLSLRELLPAAAVPDQQGRGTRVLRYERR